MIMVLIATLRTDLLDDWQTNLPEDAPNVFAINIQDYQVEPFKQALSDHNIAEQKLFATIPGRLLSINDQAVNDMSIAEDSAINRDLILTADNALPVDNGIVKGRWHTANSRNEVSVEEKLAERLEVSLGDTLGFRIGGQDIEVRISSIRQVVGGIRPLNSFWLFFLVAFKTFLFPN